MINSDDLQTGVLFQFNGDPLSRLECKRNPDGSVYFDWLNPFHPRPNIRFEDLSLCQLQPGQVLRNAGTFPSMIAVYIKLVSIKFHQMGSSEWIDWKVEQLGIPLLLPIWKNTEYWPESDILSCFVYDDGGRPYFDSFDLKANKAPDASQFPHVCRKCGAPAYNGFTKLECSNKMCK